MRDITARAGISYATFRHHSTTEALLDHVAAEQIDLMVEDTLPALDAVDSRAAAGALCAYVADHRPSRGARSRDDQTADWLPAEPGILCPVGAIIEIITWWLRQEPGAYPIKQIATVLHRFALVPLLGPTD